MTLRIRRHGLIPAIGLVGILLFSAWPRSAFAQTEEKKAAEKQPKRGSWIVLPILFYSPETKLALGGSLAYVFRPKGAPLTSRPSSYRSILMVTTSKQFQIGLFPDIFLKDESYRIQGFLLFNRFVDQFYGIGNDTSLDDVEKYTSRGVGTAFSLQKRVRSHFNVAVQHQFFYQKLVETEAGGMLEPGTIPGSEPATLSGLSLSVNWDSRDNIFFPSRGSFHEITASVFDSAIGSDYNYRRLVLNFRKYIPVLSRHVLAFQAYYNGIDGRAPFQMLSFIGGPELMRGHYLGRYRDRHALAFQGEYRLPVWKRLGAAVFAAVGDVAPSLGKFDFEKFKVTGGFGLRFAVLPREKLNFRLDFGFGRDETRVYFTAIEAF